MVVREMFQTSFEIAGHQVITYERAQECMNACISAKLAGKMQPHDIVIVHINLGESIDGAEMIRRIRQFVPADELKFIIMSGEDLVDRNLLEQNLFTIPVLTIPIKPSELIKQVKKELARA